MKYFPLVWSALWRKPVEAILIWLAVITSFTLFDFMVGLHGTYDRLVENSRMDRLYVNTRFPFASPVGILLPLALRDRIARGMPIFLRSPLCLQTESRIPFDFTAVPSPVSTQ